jgi:branched-chain amino acid transport system substrate-binding protein
VEKAAPQLGLQLVAAEVHNFGDTDFTPQLLKIQAANPDAILITSYLKEIAIILRQSYELGLKAPRLATASVTTTIEKIVPKEALDNLIAVTPLKDVEDGPTFAGFRQALKDAAPDLAAQPGMPDYLVIMGYYNVSIFAEGLKRAGRDLTREKFITALESINNFDTGALAGKVSFSRTDHDGLRSLGYYRYTLDKASGTLGRKFIGTIDLR